MSGRGARFLRQASIYFVGTATAAAIQFACVPVFARALGSAEYGRLSVAMAAGSVMAGIMAIGGDVALARFWFDTPLDSERKQLARRWISFLTCWSIAVAVLAHAAIELLGSHVVGGSLRPLLVVAVYGLVPAQLCAILSQVLRNQMRPWSFAGSNIARALARAAGAMTGALLFDAGAMGILAGAALGDLAACLLPLALVKIQVFGATSVRAVMPLLRFGAPIVPATLAFWAYSSIDKLVLASAQPAAVVGAYSLAGTLAMPVMLVQAAVTQVWIPEISRAYGVSREGSRALLALGIEGSLLCYGAMALLLGICAGPLIRVMGGHDYAMAVPLLPVIALATAFNCTSAFTASGSTLAKKTGRVPLITVGTAMLELVALLLLVPRFGAIGAAVACAIGHLCMTAAYLHYSQHVFPVPVSGRLLVLEVVALLGAGGCMASEGTTGVSASVTAVVLVVFAVRGVHLAKQAGR